MKRGGRLQRRTPLSPVSERRRAGGGCPQWSTFPPRVSCRSWPPRVHRLPAKSAKRAPEDRERAQLLRRLFPDYEWHGCAVPGCGSEATDPHEPLTRARGGSITDPNNIVGLCRRHHGDIHGEPPWAYELGLLRHSWEA